MGAHSDKARETLLDAAEELFACHGIDSVSNRRIAEHAGTANHSAVAYHFGSRDELLRALLHRHLEEMTQRRAALLTVLAPDAGLRDIVACLIMPWIDHLAAQPVPSWRARFLFQVRGMPSVEATLSGIASDNQDVERLLQRMQAHLSGLAPQVIEGRATILGPMILGVCAGYEAKIQDGTETPNWRAVGYFFIDACTGMLTAPVSHPDDFPSVPVTPFLI